MSVRSLGRTKSAKKTPRRGANLLFLVIAVIGSVHALAMLSLEVSRLVYTEREVARLERDISSLEGEARDLQDVIAHKGDARYREKLARLQGFVHPDEARYVTLSEAPADPVD